MSHFAGLVILTPNYKGDLESALERYDENTEVPEYSSGAVSDYEKIAFISHYTKKYSEGDLYVLKLRFYNKLVEDGAEIEASEAGDEFKRIVNRSCYDHKEDYAKFVLSIYPDFLDEFEDLYKENGFDWNGNSWRLNHITNTLEEYSTYNPNSKWDWYDCGGRWSKTIKTKSGEYVNECLLGEIDWSPFSDDDYEEELAENIWGEKYRKLKEGVKYHFTKESLPFCFVIDGEWVEKGEMGWFGMTANEMSNDEWNKKMMEIMERLPSDSECYLVDFHI